MELQGFDPVQSVGRCTYTVVVMVYYIYESVRFNM